LPPAEDGAEECELDIDPPDMDGAGMEECEPDPMLRSGATVVLCIPGAEPDVLEVVGLAEMVVFVEFEEFVEFEFVEWDAGAGFAFSTCFPATIGRPKMYWVCAPPRAPPCKSSSVMMRRMDTGAPGKTPPLPPGLARGEPDCGKPRPGEPMPDVPGVLAVRMGGTGLWKV